MIATPNHHPKLTPAEYFAWEEQQHCRHEYINGEVYAMSGGSQNHSRIALKFGALLTITCSIAPVASSTPIAA
jgi:Uma2 family endonuclease